ncbi:MAG: class I SAM-dependent methyltransferase, partial [bacterium]
MSARVEDAGLIGDSRLVEHHRAMLGGMGVSLQSGATVLDFGCGAGRRVYQYRKAGFRAFGVDFPDDWSSLERTCVADGLALPGEALCRALESAPYRIPFPDASFDFVFSEQVFEHVQNYEEAIAEIHRVLKADGCTLHDFPARWRPIEAHVHVPFAGVWRSRFYLGLWARLGVRNEFQHGLAADEVTARNAAYLTTQTKYLPKREIARHFERYFRIVRFAESLFIQHSWGRLHRLSRLAQLVPGVDRVAV